MHADHAQITGSPHLRDGAQGQDYSTSGSANSALAWGVIADGCSSGDIYSGIGAALLAIAAGRVLPSLGACHSHEEFERAVIGDVEPFIRWLGESNFRATLGAIIADGRHATITLLGDGAFAAVRSDGSFELVSVTYSGNAPYYPIYSTDQNHLARWREAYGGDREVRRWLVSPGHPPVEDPSPVEACMAWTLDLAEQPYVAIAVFSDGIAARKGASIFDTVSDLVAFKTTKGSFARRRLARASADWTKNNTYPSDDLSMAVIWLGAEEGE